MLCIYIMYNISFHYHVQWHFFAMSCFNTMCYTFTIMCNITFHHYYYYYCYDYHVKLNEILCYGYIHYPVQCKLLVLM